MDRPKSELIDQSEEFTWIWVWREEVESDMSVLHRVDDMWSMPSPRFFRLAKRLPCYQGAVRAALREHDAGQQQAPGRPAETGRPSSRGLPGHREWLPEDAPGARAYEQRRSQGEDIHYVPPTYAALSTSDFNGLFSYGRG